MIDQKLKGICFTQSDIDDDPEFFDEMAQGKYDVPCDECHGSGETEVVDESNLTPDQQIVFNAWQNLIEEEHRELAWYAKWQEQTGLG